MGSAEQQIGDFHRPIKLVDGIDPHTSNILNLEIRVPLGSRERYAKVDLAFCWIFAGSKVC